MAKRTSNPPSQSSPSIRWRKSDREESVASSILPERLEGPLLCTIHEIEHWQHDNEYLLAHYRRVSNSYLKSLKSLFYLHNQTGNIYSHLIGVLLFISWAHSTFNDLLKRYPTSDINDILVFAGFFAGALTCFGLSAFFHTFGNHSHDVYHTWLLLDLYGIFALIVGTVFSATYYGFYCERIWWKVYSIGITIITLACATFCTNPRFRAPKWRGVRAFLFVSIGWSGAIPMTHAVQKWGRAQVDAQMGWDILFLEGLLYITGAFIYAARIPERWRPGTFDIWGNSHQLFHMFAVFGAVMHLRGIITAFDYAHDPATRRVCSER
ncbi:HlyIII-domain-containing protein [Venturia nashicola]|uniref:HlyIII-domain-containing protein n=1 Tax=Venturia nashicola TaxID=86259 RepID=A0A4Z1P2A5_9PEZI|nr:HlyIII-domain-containing protein [Venturia nashicola]TLD35638.1 HlyIII-domain-containing protein [Venturia nashicola]